MLKTAIIGFVLAAFANVATAQGIDDFNGQPTNNNPGNQQPGNWNPEDHNDHNDHNGPGNEQYCGQYDGQPEWCSNTPGCQYDYQWNRCTQGGGGGGNRACRAYDFDPQTCNDQPNCQFDYQQNICADSWQQPQGQCWYYNNNPQQCSRTPGCSWDRFGNQCVDDYNPRPQPRTAQTTIYCGSGDYRFERCQAPGEVVSAYLIRQDSWSSCQQRATWDYDQNGIWVDRGCRGVFSVTYYVR